jgi:hypothetical protein
MSKLLYVDDGKGHFATGLRSRAEDLALLDHWLESPDRQSKKKKYAPRTKNRMSKYKMLARSRKNRKNMTRKNRKNLKASRKNRKANRKSRRN